MAQIKEVVLGTKYVDRKNAKRIGEVIEVNEKTKTVMLQFDNGQSRGFSLPTLSKSFKILEAGEEVKKEAEKKAEPKAEKSVEAEKKPAEKAEAKAEKSAKTEKKKKEPAVSVDQEAYKKDFLKKVEAFGFKTVVPEKYPYHINLKLVDKNTASVKLASSRIKVRTKKEFLPKGTEFNEVKGGYSATLFYPYEKFNDMLNLLKYIADTFKDSDLVKKQSKKKAESENKTESKKAETKTEPKKETTKKK